MKNVHVILAAGGSGSRFAADVKKQFLMWNGESVLQKSIQAFSSHPRVAQMVVVLPVEDLAKHQFSDARLRCVAGGVSRAESVRNGFFALADVADEDCVLVHDAARPCVSRALIDRVIAKTEEDGAAIAAIPMTDTIKKVAGKHVVETLDRTNLCAAQTPQAARYKMFQQAFSNPKIDLSRVTDEAMLLQNCGFKVFCVEGEKRNIKLTTAEDLDLMQFFLQKDHA